MQTPFFFLNNDSKLLDALRNGDEEALVELFRQNRRPITSLVTRNQGSEDDAEDVLQEAVVVLWQRVRSGSFEYQAKLSTFIYATAKNIWFRRLARHRRELPATDEALMSHPAMQLRWRSWKRTRRVLAVQKAMEQMGIHAAIFCFFIIGKNDRCGRNSDETRVCQCRYSEVEKIPVQEVSGAFSEKHAWRFR